MAAAWETTAWRIGLAKGVLLIAAGLACALRGYLTWTPGIEGVVTRWWATPAASTLLVAGLFLLGGAMVARPGSGLPVARVLAILGTVGALAGFSIAGLLEWQQGTTFDADKLAAEGAMAGAAAGVVVAIVLALRRWFGLALGAIVAGAALGLAGAMLINRFVPTMEPRELDLTVTSTIEQRSGGRDAGTTEVRLRDAIGRSYRIQLGCLCGGSLPVISQQRFIVLRGAFGYDSFIAIEAVPPPPPPRPSA